MLSVTGDPGFPILMNVPPTTCDSVSDNQVTLQWTPPTDTGGPGVDIDHYVVDVIESGDITGSDGVACSPEPCNMTTTTSTTITGLLCDISYTVTVRAVNCRNKSSSSTPKMFSVTAPGEFKTLCVNFCWCL